VREFWRIERFSATITSDINEFRRNIARIFWIARREEMRFDRFRELREVVGGGAQVAIGFTANVSVQSFVVVVVIVVCLYD
jgi:hypothetical protein